MRPWSRFLLKSVDFAKDRILMFFVEKLWVFSGVFASNRILVFKSGFAITHLSDLQNPGWVDQLIGSSSSYLFLYIDGF